MNYRAGSFLCKLDEISKKLVSQFGILILFSLIFVLSFIGCSSNEHLAPVLEASIIESIPHSGIHKVEPGETLYAIAWRYGLDYRILAKRNHLKAPYIIHTGQTVTVASTTSAPLFRMNAHAQLAPGTEQWLAPVKGKIVDGFSARNKGVDYAGHEGNAVYAANQGRVVYCGAGIRGYGNLIILKHAGEYMSAYAHNRQVLVKEGQWVRKGQQIAEMGKSESGRIMLHFEIRRAGKPIDPLLFLKGF